MTKTKKATTIILASGSLSRQALLTQAGLEYTIVESKVKEKEITAPTPQERVVKLAKEKAKDVAGKVKPRIIIAADTVVLYKNKVLEKPTFKMDALTMLQSLSGDVHTVLTGWTVLNSKTHKSYQGYSETYVTFRKISKEELTHYVNENDVTQWAAGYNTMRSEALHFIKKVEGSLTGLNGLPLDEIVPLVQKELEEF